MPNSPGSNSQAINTTFADGRYARYNLTDDYDFNLLTTPGFQSVDAQSARFNTPYGLEVAVSPDSTAHTWAIINVVSYNVGYQIACPTAGTNAGLEMWIRVVKSFSGHIFGAWMRMATGAELTDVFSGNHTYAGTMSFSGNTNFNGTYNTVGLGKRFTFRSSDPTNLYGYSIGDDGPTKGISIKDDSTGNKMRILDTILSIVNNSGVVTSTFAKTYQIAAQVIHLPGISDMQSYTGTSTTVVVDTALRGGAFIQKTGSVTPDGGVNFHSAISGKYWHRQRTESSDYQITWWGVKADSSQDNTVQIQQAINYVTQKGGIISFIPGIYRGTNDTLKSGVYLRGFFNHGMTPFKPSTSIADTINVVKWQATTSGTILTTPNAITGGITGATCTSAGVQGIGFFMG